MLRLRSAALLAAAALVLTACSTAPPEEPVVSVDDAATESAAPVAETDAETASEEPAVELDPQSCLHGTWLADNAFFLQSLQEFGDEPTDVSGAVTMDFAADGSLVTDYDDWTMTFIVEGATSILTRTGTDLGTYTADDTSISIRDAEVGSVLTLEAMGTSMVIPPDPVDYFEVDYTCSADDLSIVTPDGTLLMSR